MRPLQGDDQESDAQVEHGWSITANAHPSNWPAKPSTAPRWRMSSAGGFTHLYRGWYRIAVSLGPNARRWTGRQPWLSYTSRTPRARDLGRDALAREFVPGEPLASSAHCRHFPVVKPPAFRPSPRRRGLARVRTPRCRAGRLRSLPEVMEASGGAHPRGARLREVGVDGAAALKSAARGGDGPAGRLHRVARAAAAPAIAHQVDVLGRRPGLVVAVCGAREPNHALRGGDARDAAGVPGQLMVERAAVRQTRRDLAVMTLRWSLPIEMNRNPEGAYCIRAVVLLWRSRPPRCGRSRVCTRRPRWR